MKKIFALTGIRSDYDILFPVLKLLNSDSSFDLKVIVSGAHLSSWHNNSIEQIEKDGFEICDKIDSLLDTSRNTQRPKAVSLLINGLTQVLDREKPDILLVLGDREESIAATVVGNYMDILVAHLAGGDPTFGNSDDPIRFACSKLAHIHFTFTEQYSKNLIKLGEEEFRICCGGNPNFSNIHNTQYLTKQELSNVINFDLNETNYIVLIQHPLSYESANSGEQMNILLNSVKQFSKKYNFKVIGIYPNTDPGSSDIIDAINKYDDHETIKFYKNLPRESFINLIRHTNVLIGNSSMGVLETPFYKIPAINVGNRQKGRLQAGNVEFVTFNNDEIIKALEKACFDKQYLQSVHSLSNLYGDESSASKVVDFLKNIDLNDKRWYVKSKLI